MIKFTAQDHDFSDADIVEYLHKYKYSTWTLPLDRARNILASNPDLTWDARGSTWAIIVVNPTGREMPPL